MFSAGFCLALKQNSLVTGRRKKIEWKMRWNIWCYYLTKMCDIDSRHAVYLQRLNDGQDTHRDDIGTIAERDNIRRGKYCKFGFCNINYRSLKEVDIHMTLLEDGRIPYSRFEKIYEGFFEKEMAFNVARKEHTFVNSMKQMDSKEALRVRLMKKLTKKKGTKCGCNIGSCRCPD